MTERAFSTAILDRYSAKAHQIALEAANRSDLQEMDRIAVLNTASWENLETEEMWRDFEQELRDIAEQRDKEEDG